MELKSDPLKLLEARLSIIVPESLLPFKSFSFSSSYAWKDPGLLLKSFYHLIEIQKLCTGVKDQRLIEIEYAAVKNNE